jgi:hypothetical protein
MKLFACMCNQPQRLSAALAPVRGALVAPPHVSRWGLGYIQGGDVLLVRTPRASELPIDLGGPLTGSPAEIATDCAIAIAVRDVATIPTLGGTDNTPPFRFRRWLFAQSGVADFGDATPRLLERIPEYLRRNLRGRTPTELVFHVFLAMLHDEGTLDDPNLPTTVTRRALASTLHLVNVELERAQRPSMLGNLALSNGRSMIVARVSEPLRMRRLWVLDDRGNRDDAFRGVILVSGGDGDARDGFEDVAANTAVLVSRDLQVSFADLG